MPAKAPKPISLTVEDRILLYLLEYEKFEDAYEAPVTVTQAGISKGVGIHRKHVPRAIRSLGEKGFVVERVARVEHSGKRKTYWLTERGHKEAAALLAAVQETEVIVRDERGMLRKVNLKDVNAVLPTSVPVLEVIMHLSENGVFDYSSYTPEAAAELPPQPLPRKKTQDRLEIYSAALHRAWMDGTLTPDEKEILEALRETLAISEEEHRELEASITKSIPSLTAKRREMYYAMLEKAWERRTLTATVQAILEDVRKALNIDYGEHLEIESAVLARRSRFMRENLEFYRSAVEQAWDRDRGMIRPEKRDFLMSLRRILEIPPEEHARLIAQLEKQND